MNSTFPVNLLGSRQNLKSAEAAGEGYPERSSLPINAIGTAVAALLGSHFPNMTNEYRKEIFAQIKSYLARNDDISDLTIAGDFNQSVALKEV